MHKRTSQTIDHSAGKATNSASASPRVAFQGEPGAFSEIAIRQHWPDATTLVPCRTFADTVTAVVSHGAQYAAIPVENAIAGVVEAAVAALDGAEGRIVVLGEQVIPVHLCLMARPGASLAGLRRVFSHQMALAQCQAFLSRHPWLMPTVHDDTAGAARDVSVRGDFAEGAIAADAAAARYGLEVLARQIQDVPDNWTRFVIIHATDAA